MTPAGVTLTLPAPPRQRRRRRGLGLVASIFVHGVFVVVILMPWPRSGLRAQRAVAAAAQKTVWVTPAAVVQPPRPTPLAPTATPIAYAAAPKALAPARDWRELLPKALALQAAGINAPSFVVDNLDPQVVTTLVGRHLALLVAGRPPFDRDARQVRWTGGGAADLVPLPVSWAQRVARRAIVLPRQWMQILTLATDEQVYLFITTDLDAAILAAQLAAAEQRGVALGALSRTRGRLLSTADGALAFHIDTVESVK